MTDKRRFHFSQKKESRGGKFSMYMAGLSFLMFLADVIFSFANGGKAGYLAGVIGLAALLFSVYGFYCGMKSFSEEKEISPVWSVLGTLASGVTAVGWITIFMSGI